MSRGTLDPASLSSISPTGFSPSLIRFPKTVRLLIRVPYAVHNPRGARTTVWALSISLAATLEIEVSFFSSGYLDVSVPPVPFIRYGLAYGYLRFAQVGFPIRISPDQWIFAPPRAFRSLSRPSSALSAKASTLRS